MEKLFILFLIAATSVTSYAFMTRRGADTSALRSACKTVLECIGAATLFFIANGALGTALILAIRGLTPLFISVYVLNNSMPVLVVLSMVQGFVFHIWWDRCSSARAVHHSL